MPAEILRPTLTVSGQVKNVQVPTDAFVAAQAATRGVLSSEFTEKFVIEPEPRHGGRVYRSGSHFHEVYGAILERYLALGGPGSYLGLPLSKELDADEGGRVSQFEHGAIFWWPDTGAIDLDRVVVRCVGVHVFGKTAGPGADELYALFGVVAPTGGQALASRIAEDVEGGQTRGYDLVLYQGKPAGLVVSATLMEHDSGSPEGYLRSLEAGVDAAMEGGKTAIGYIPVFGPILSTAYDAFVTEEVKKSIARAIADVFGLDDDNLGTQSLMLGMKRLVTTAVAKKRTNWGFGYDFESELYRAQGGSWKLLYSIAKA